MIFLEVQGAGVLGDNSVAHLVGILGVGEAEDVHLDAGGEQRDDRMHVLGDAGGGVQGSTNSLFNHEVEHDRTVCSLKPGAASPSVELEK